MPEHDLPYQFPDSSVENERLMNQHVGVKLAMGGRLCTAPIDLTRPDLKVLDAGTSDGYWLDDFKKELRHPETAKLIGTDITGERFPTNPREGIQLIQQSSLGPFPPEWAQSFDLVHQRFTLIPVGPNVQSCVKKLMELVKPGGWIQLVELDLDDREPNGPSTLGLGKLLARIEEALGTDTSYKDGGMENWFREGGFVRVGTMLAPLSLGAECPNPEMREQTASAWVFTAAEMIKGCHMLPGGLQVMTEEQGKTFPKELHEELLSKGGYLRVRVTWAKRPVSA